MSSATACGCDIITTWEASTSTEIAPARSAMARRPDTPIVLSPVAISAQEGRFFQPAGP